MRTDAVLPIQLFHNLSFREIDTGPSGSRHALPATFSNRDCAEIGGLMSYIVDAFRQVGVYTGRILRREACGATGTAVEQVRVGYQSPDRQDAWSHR